MAVVYGTAAVIGFAALVGWAMAHAMGEGGRFDPEERFGATGRRLVAAILGFGLGGASAEYAALSISAPVVFGLALLAGVAMAVISDRIRASTDSEA